MAKRRSTSTFVQLAELFGSSRPEVDRLVRRMDLTAERFWRYHQWLQHRQRFRCGWLPRAEAPLLFDYWTWG